jgi:hypothetical protein
MRASIGVLLLVIVTLVLALTLPACQTTVNELDTLLFGPGSGVSPKIVSEIIEIKLLTSGQIRDLQVATPVVIPVMVNPDDKLLIRSRHTNAADLVAIEVEIDQQPVDTFPDELASVTVCWRRHSEGVYRLNTRPDDCDQPEDSAEINVNWPTTSEELSLTWYGKKPGTYQLTIRPVDRSRGEIGPISLVIQVQELS